MKHPAAPQSGAQKPKIISLEIPELNIFLEGSLEEIYLELWKNIHWLWQEYVESSEENMTGDAKDLKNKMLLFASGQCELCIVAAENGEA